MNKSNECAVRIVVGNSTFGTIFTVKCNVHGFVGTRKNETDAIRRADSHYALHPVKSSI